MADVAITKSKSITIRGGQIPSSPVIPETPEDPVTVPPTIEAGIGLTKTANVIKLGDNVNHIFALEPTYKQFASFLQWAVNNHISLISGYSDVDRSETSVGAYNFTPMGSNNKQSVINLQRYLGSHVSMSLKTINSNTGEEIGFLIRENEVGASVFEAVDDLELKGITYKADYSANYTNRSLVDKEYVDGVSSYPEAVERANNTVLFDQDYIIGNAGARTGAILFSFTSAKRGATTEMCHDGASVTFPTEAMLMFDVADISTTADNYFMFVITNITASSEVVRVYHALEGGTT